MRLGITVSAVGIVAYGHSKLIKESTAEHDHVGVHKTENGGYRTVERSMPPYQFFGGLEGGREPFMRRGSSTKSQYYPKGVYKVSGFAYGDCAESFNNNFFVDAMPIDSDSEDINVLDRQLPRKRQKVQIDGVVRLKKSGNHIFKVESESPFWGLRIERMTKDGTPKNWEGEEGRIKELPSKKHCWTAYDYQREDAKNHQKIDDIYFEQDRKDMRRRDRLYR